MSAGRSVITFSIWNDFSSFHFYCKHEFMNKLNMKFLVKRCFSFCHTTLPFTAIVSKFSISYAKWTEHDSINVDNIVKINSVNNLLVVGATA